MFVFGNKSRVKLATCHESLEAVAYRAIQLTPYDFGIIHGFRGKQIQDALFDSGASQTPYPKSKHNHTDHNGNPESLAIDFAVYIEGGRLSWDETHIYAVVAGCMFAAAKELGVTLRWGGDWDGDGNTKEHSLQDWGHMELYDD